MVEVARTQEGLGGCVATRDLVCTRIASATWSHVCCGRVAHTNQMAAFCLPMQGVAIGARKHPDVDGNGGCGGDVHDICTTGRTSTF